MDKPTEILVRANTSTLLPDDLVIEILEYLPISSLMRFRCVSKSWSNLTKCPNFIRNHLFKRGNNGRMLLMRRHFSTPFIDADDVLCFHDLDSVEQVRPNLTIPFKGISLTQHEAHFLGPCNGIVCIINNGRVMLSNPALKEFRCLPLLPYQYDQIIIMGAGFGIDSRTNDFKVVFIREISDFVQDIDRKEVRIYNTSTNTWRQTDFDGNIHIHHNPSNEFFLNGACHWLVSTTGDYSMPKKILCFDISNEVFKQMEFPEDDVCERKCCNYLRILNNRLTMLQQNKVKRIFYEIEVWVMKEYGIRSSWTKEFVIETDKIMYPLTCNDKSFLLIQPGGPLFSVKLHNNQITQLQIQYAKPPTHQILKIADMRKMYYFQTLIYEESLISLNQIIKSS